MTDEATVDVPASGAEPVTGIQGHLTVELFDENGERKAFFEGSNLITDVGDQLYAERGSGAATPALPTGMKLGAGGTAVAKTGAGAALVTYLAGSNKAFDSTPASAQPGGAGTARVITYVRTYAAGEATTASPITEAVIVTETISNDDTSTAAETISRMLIANIPAKGATDSLVLTWKHSFLGS